MPKYIIVSEWDNVSGITIKAEYPGQSTKILNEDSILKIFSSTAITKEAGLVNIYIRDIRVISYYSGPSVDKHENQILISLILSEEDNPSLFEKYLNGIAQLIINKLNRENFLSEDLIIDCFECAQTIKDVPKEYLNGILLNDKINWFILELLREGPITKEQFGKYLSNEFNQKISNIDKYLKPFVDNNFIVIQKIKDSIGRISEYLLLIKDVYIYRTPPIKTLVNLEEVPNLSEKFYTETEKIFMDYNPTPDDSKKLAELISNPVKYEVLKILRNEFVKYDLLSQQIGFELKNIQKHLTELLNNRIAVAIKDQTGGYWLFLLNDIQIVEEFPRYMIDVLQKSTLHNEIDEMVAIKHSELLKDELISEKLEVLQ